MKGVSNAAIERQRQMAASISQERERERVFTFTRNLCRTYGEDEKRLKRTRSTSIRTEHNATWTSCCTITVGKAQRLRKARYTCIYTYVAEMTFPSLQGGSLHRSLLQDHERLGGGHPALARRRRLPVLQVVGRRSHLATSHQTK